MSTDSDMRLAILEGMQVRIDELEARLGRAARQLEAIAFNAESHHAGEDGCRRALAVIAQRARDPDSVPEGVAVLAEQEKKP